MNQSLNDTNAFMNEYSCVKSDNIKDNYISKLVLSESTYIPYNEKINSIDNIIRKAHYEPEGKILYNKPNEYKYYILTVINLYTQFSIDINKDNDLFFDFLNQYKIIDKIWEKLPEDKQAFDALFSMRLNDLLLNSKLL